MEQKKYLDLEGLTEFKTLMQDYVDDEDALSIKGVGLSRDGKSIQFYKTLPIEGATPEYSFEFPVQDISNLMELVTSAEESDIAIFDANGQVIDSGTAISDLATMAYVGEIPAGYEATTIAEYAKELADNVASHGYDDTALATRVTNVENGLKDVEETLEEKADSATTLEGYGIEDAYTKEETDNAIATAVANADHLKREIVDVLPNARNADENTIYMVPKAGTTGEYDEYMFVNGTAIKIGDSSVDLTDYATIEYVDNLDRVKSVTTGSTEGTISVDGTDVEVNGLGSAAFTDSSAYDEAGAAEAVIGTAGDTAEANTVYGAKAYTDSLFEENLVAITKDEVDALFG